MKAKLVLVMAISLMGSVAFAQESASAKFAVVSQNNPGVFKVIYDNPGASKAKMNIYRSNGERIFSEAVSVDGFVRPINFKGMYNDKYSIELIDNTGRYVATADYSS